MISSALQRIAALLCVLTLTLATACGGSGGSAGNNATNANNDVANRSYTGLLSDGSVVTLVFGAQPTSAVGAAGTTSLTAAVAAWTVTGQVKTPDGTTIPVSGSYDSSTGAFTVSGGGYTISGTYSDGTFQGTYTGSGSSGAFAAGDITTVTKYCGTYSGDDSGTYLIVATGQKAYLVVSSHVFAGTIAGNSIAFSSSDPPANVTGTISGSSISGSWTGGGGASGTWSGTTGACPQ